MHEKLYPIPASHIANPDLLGAMCMGVERAPKSVIAEVIPNPIARDLLSKDDQYLASEDYLANNVWMSVSRPRYGKQIISLFDYGRAVPIAYANPDEPVQFGPFLGNTLTGKGSWLGGFKRSSVSAGMRSMFCNHPGLLSVEGAQGDVEISNVLLSENFRAALHTGYVVFRPGKLKDWLLYQWRDTPHAAVIRDSFEQIKKSGNPAYLFRFGGSTNRYGSSMGAAHTKAEISRSARLILKENSIANSHTQNILTLLGMYREDAVSALSKIATMQSLTLPELTSYVHFLSAIYGQNAEALTRVNDRLTTYVLDGYALGEAKDVDQAHFSYDFDVVPTTENPDIKNRAVTIERYFRNARSSAGTHFDTVLHLFFPEWSISGAKISELNRSISTLLPHYLEGWHI